MMINHLYLHVPFCKTICAYCDFCHQVYQTDVCDKWLDRLEKEFKECKEEQYKTIYIGGGTPSSLSLKQLERLLLLVSFHSYKVEEYTIEVNPENLDEDKVKLFIKYGINRISMGLQSSNDDELKLMNRHHTFKDVKEKIELLRKYNLNNISLDIMYSLPNQSMDSLKKTVDDVLSLNVPHLSLYSLTIEENSIFFKKGYSSLNEEIEADMYEYIVETLEKNGYRQYEIANFAKDNFESRHNLGYWRYDDYRALSCGSTSKINHVRYEKTRDINSYINGGEIISNKEELSIMDEAFENLMMSLRTSEGLDILEFERRYNLDPLFIYKDAINKHLNNLRIEDNHLICTSRNILNTILVDFLNE